MLYRNIYAAFEGFLSEKPHKYYGKTFHLLKVRTLKKKFNPQHVFLSCALNTETNFNFSRGENPNPSPLWILHIQSEQLLDAKLSRWGG